MKYAFCGESVSYAINDKNIVFKSSGADETDAQDEFSKAAVPARNFHS
jgi:hypothetical protein